MGKKILTVNLGRAVSAEVPAVAKPLSLSTVVSRVYPSGREGENCSLRSSIPLKNTLTLSYRGRLTSAEPVQPREDFDSVVSEGGGVTPGAGLPCAVACRRQH